jgi:long-chain-fatty-acid--CoA ligase ACSBG
VWGKDKYKPENPADLLENRMSSASCCTFIYISGTPGPPKAVMISHDNYTWTADAVNRRFQFDAEFRNGQKRLISMLPLSHVAAQFIDLVTAPRVRANLFFTDSTALQGNLMRFLLIARP